MSSAQRSLEGKTALVTGGATGIGAAIAKRLVEDGACVCIAGRRVEALRELLGVLPEGSAVAQSGDVACEADTRAMAETAAALGGGSLDIVVNNAAAPVNGTVETVSLEEWQRALDVNLTGAFLVTRAALPYLRASAGASVVNVASVAALVANPGVTPYATSKAALVAFSRQCAVDLGADGIRVNVVCPGWVRTEMSELQMDGLAHAFGGEREGAFGAVTNHQPLRRVGEPSEVAAAVAFLASDDASYMTGALLAVDGGSAAISPLAEVFARAGDLA